MYFKKLVGSKCYLSPLDVGDAAKFTAWLNDQEIVDYLQNSTSVINEICSKNAIETFSGMHSYAIVDLDTDELIGKIGLININHINQTAEIELFIGNKNYWNSGYGQEALNLLIDYSFKILNLNNILMKTYSFNKRGIACFEKVGFSRIGERRKAVKRNLEYHNIVIMDILPEDFYRN